MALIALTTGDIFDFVSVDDPSRTVKQVPIDPADPSKGEKDEVVIGEDASVFKVRSLDAFLMAHIWDNASVMRGRQGDNEVDLKTRVHQTNLDAVRFGLANLPDNFKDRKGRNIKFSTYSTLISGRKYDAVDDSVLNSLGLRLIGEMADKIKEISEVSPAEEKN